MSGNMITDRREYPLGRVQAAEVELEVLSGSLSVSGGSEQFCSATFEYSHPELRPIDEYEMDDDEAELAISQPPTSGLNNARSMWNLTFNSDAALEMAIASSSGSVRLNLDKVNVSNLEVQSRSGKVEAKLGGSYPELDDVTIDSRSGRVALDLDGDFPNLSQVEIESRSGNTDLAVGGNCPELKRIAIDAMSGNVGVDLRGQFQQDDLGLRVDCKSGNVRVRLPGDVGVSMSADTKSGNVRAEGFSIGSGRRTNAAFGHTPATIWLNIHVMSGNIDVVSD